MEQTCEHKYCAEDADWDMPGDDLLPQHIEQAYDKCEGTDLTHRSGSIRMVTDEEVER